MALKHWIVQRVFEAISDGYMEKLLWGSVLTWGFFLVVEGCACFFGRTLLSRVYILTRVPHLGSLFRAFLLRPICISVRAKPLF